MALYPEGRNPKLHLIEGFFVSEKNLKRSSQVGTPQKESSRGSQLLQGRQIPIWTLLRELQKQKILFGIPLVRQTSKTIGERGEFRKGDSRITGAKIIPPPGLYVDDWMASFEEHVNQGFLREGFFNFLARQHVLFETIHPLMMGMEELEESS